MTPFFQLWRVHLFLQVSIQDYGQPQRTSYAVHVGQNIAGVGSAMTQKNVWELSHLQNTSKKLVQIHCEIIPQEKQTN